MAPFRTLAGAAILATLLPSCAGGNAASQLAKGPEFQPKDQSKCGVTKSQAHPLIVEWPSADRQELESKVRGGVVAVRYRGCEMDVLERCSVPSKYGYLGTTRAQDRIVMKDADDLYTNLPVGAARLEGKLERSGQLTVDMSLVGRYEADKTTVRADELAGDCAGATHFIYGMSVGAFDFYAGADANVGGTVGVAGFGAGGHSQATREALTKNGDPDACAKATSADKAPPEGCGALIRIEVVPLGEPKKLDAACPDGTQWDGSQCIGKKVVTHVDCPAGSSWDGSGCAGGAGTGASARESVGAAAPHAGTNLDDCAESRPGQFDLSACTVGCNAGSARACYRLGEMYRVGDGVQRDQERGISLLRRSCTMGDVSFACTRLHALHVAGY